MADKKPSTGSSNSMSFDLSQPRSLEAAFGIGATYSRDSRAAMSAADKAKFAKLAQEPLEHKFTATDFNAIVGTNKILSKSFDFGAMVQRLRRRLIQFGMLDVFQIPNDIYNYSESTGPSLTDTLDLLTQYAGMDLMTIKLWTEFILTYMDTMSIENLQFTQTLLLESCDEGLYQKVHNELSTMEAGSMGGPLVFYLITRHTVVLTDKTTRAFVYQLQKTRITDYENEDVNEFAANFSSAARLLEASEKLPDDIRDIAYDSLKVCSVYEFRNHLTILWTTNSHSVRTWEMLLQTAQNLYQELVLKNTWKSAKKKGSAFKATTETESPNTANNAATKSKPRPKFKIDRTPPKQGESHTRARKDGKGDEHWCAKCKDGGRWGNHGTDGHDKWVQEFQSKIKAKKSPKPSSHNQTSPTTESATELNQEALVKLRPALKHGNSANYYRHF
jgi:hypothetical protein